jgi:sodium/bile acid cotransporter 7
MLSSDNISLVRCAFSTCFSTSALSDLSTPSILLTVFLNIGIYIFLTIICFAICRPPTPKSLKHKKYTPRPIPPGETIAICFCGPAKTTGLGIPLLYAMYRSTAPDDMLRNAKTSVAVILYTTEQIFCAHFMVQLFRRWKRKVELSGPVAESDDIRSTEAEMAERTDVVENNSRI